MCTSIHNEYNLPIGPRALNKGNLFDCNSPACPLLDFSSRTLCGVHDSLTHVSLRPKEHDPSRKLTSVRPFGLGPLTRTRLRSRALSWGGPAPPCDNPVAQAEASAVHFAHRAVSNLAKAFRNSHPAASVLRSVCRTGKKKHRDYNVHHYVQTHNTNQTHFLIARPGKHQARARKPKR